MDAAANTTEYFYCREQLTGGRFPDGSTRAAGFDNFKRHDAMVAKHSDKRQKMSIVRINSFE